MIPGMSSFVETDVKRYGDDDLFFMFLNLDCCL